MGLFRKKKIEEKKEKKKTGKKKIEEFDVREKINQGWVRCIIVLEIVGKPAEYIREAMKLVLKGINKEKDLEIIHKKLHKVKKIESIFSTFVEVEMITKGFKKLIEFVLNYMPSSIEIMEPASLKFEINDATNFANDLSKKLQGYYTKVNRLTLENEILKKQLEELKEK